MIYYSQFGEDQKLFDIYNRKTNGLCIEVGANNGIDDSTTLFFEKIGWKCILVEPNPFLCQNIRKIRKALLYECAASNKSDTRTLYMAEGAERSDGMSTISTKDEVHSNIKNHGFILNPVQVKTMTLDEILTHAKINSDIDFISIDVEGHEYEVLEGFSIDKWKPCIILIEDNFYSKNPLVRKYLKKYGYIRFMRTGVNDWYAHQNTSRFVNRRNIIKAAWVTFKLRIASKFLKNIIVTQYMQFDMKVRNRLRKIPLLVKLKKILTIKKGQR